MLFSKAIDLEKCVFYSGFSSRLAKKASKLGGLF